MKTSGKYFDLGVGP